MIRGWVRACVRDAPPLDALMVEIRLRDSESEAKLEGVCTAVQDHTQVRTRDAFGCGEYRR